MNWKAVQGISTKAAMRETGDLRKCVHEGVVETFDLSDRNSANTHVLQQDVEDLGLALQFHPSRPIGAIRTLERRGIIGVPRGFTFDAFGRHLDIREILTSRACGHAKQKVRQLQNAGRREEQERCSLLVCEFCDRNSDSDSDLTGVFADILTGN